MDLYRYFDVEDRLLYVGVSIHAAVRMMRHAKKPWWNEVVSVQVEHLTLEEAWAGEREAVLNEHPRYNVNVPPGTVPAAAIPRIPCELRLFNKPTIRILKEMGGLQEGDRVVATKSRHKGQEGEVKYIKSSGGWAEVGVKFKGKAAIVWFGLAELEHSQSIPGTHDTSLGACVDPA